MFVLLNGQSLEPVKLFGRVVSHTREADMLESAWHWSLRPGGTCQVGRVLASGEMVRCWGPLPAEAGEA